jgi:signal transduction histidine kinase
MGKKQPAHWVKTIQKFLTKPQVVPYSPEYQAWRNRFLLERLQLAIWFSFVAAISLELLSTVIKIAEQVLEIANSPWDWEEYWLDLMGASAVPLCLILGLTLLKIPQVRRYPKLLFLGFSLSMTLIWQIQATLLQFPPLLNPLPWLLIFPIIAMLVPVCWRLHLFSQLIVLGYTVGATFLFQTLFGSFGYIVIAMNPKNHQEQILAYLILAIYALIVLLAIFICNFSVHLYERVLRTEFESKRKLQIFTHGVSHDLRNPVTGTLMVLNNLLQKPDTIIPVPRAILERMAQGSDRQLSLINSLLEAHATDVRGIVLYRQSIQLNLLVESSLADLEPLLEQNQATLKNLFPSDLPLVKVDPIQLGRVFSNLISNSLTHNPPGLTLTLSATVEPQMIRCCIRDDGVGMTKEQCDHLFDLYFRSSSVRNSLGLGLGLYLCQQIIIAHGGEIGVISSPQTGAAFWFTIPIVDQY